MADKAATVAPPVAKGTVKTPTLQRKCACGGTPGASGMCPECERKARGLLQRKEAGASAVPDVTVPDSVGSTLSGPGHPLDSGTRATMERGFGTDLSHVRVHHDAQAGESARAVDAHAYTVGSDIAFAPGKYDPHSAGGQRLLAHEIAHTVQQGGLQRSAAIPLEVSPAYSAAEAEADRAADAVMAGRNAPSLMPTGATIARVKSTNAPPEAEPEPKAEAVVENKTPSSPSSAANAGLPQTDPFAGLDKAKIDDAKVTDILASPDGDRIFVSKDLPVPDKKGVGALDLYDKEAKAGTLNATIDVTSPRGSAAFKQARVDTDVMAALWLQRMGWSQSSAPRLWNTLPGGKSPTPFKPLIGTRLCQFDHIVELQVGGSQATDNVQILDANPNASSGSILMNEVARRARSIRDAHKSAKPKVVTMRFDSVVPLAGGPKAVNGLTCLDAETQARALTATPALGEAPANPVNTKLLYGTRGTDLFVDPGKATLLDVGPTANVGARMLVPGFLLNVYTHDPKGDTVEAGIDAKTLARPAGRQTAPTADALSALAGAGITVVSEPKVKFQAEEATDLATEPAAEGAAAKSGLAQKRLKFAGMDKSPLRFYYPALSTGELPLTYDEASGALTGKGGKFKSDKPILKDLDLGLDLTPDSLAVTLKAKPRSLGFIPRATVKDAAFEVRLLPTLGGKGSFTVEFGNYATASVSVEVDAQGIRADADLQAKIPKLDTAAGKVRFRDGKWSGSFEVAVSSASIPGFKNAKIVIDFADGKVTPTGTVNLVLLETDIELKAKLAGGGWYFSVSVPRIKIPGLEGPISVFVEYQDGHLKATGKNAVFVFGKWKGTLEDVTYEDGRLSGKGKVEVGKPEDRVSGVIDAQLFPNGKWTADGTVSVRIKEGLVATVGLHIDEAHKVTLKGELKFPDYVIPNTSFGNHLRKDLATLSFPIAGLSVGSRTIGFSFDVTAFVEAHWSIGPAKLTETYLKANFDPFEEQTNYDLEGHTKLVMPMDVGFGGGLEGAFSLDVLIASGKFGVRATLDLGAKLDSGVEGTLRYTNGKFSLDSRAFINARPYLSLDIAAFVHAKVVGFDPYDHSWPLKNWTLDSGFDVGISAPFKYDAERGFQVPGVDDVTVTYPDIKVGALLDKFLAKVGI